MSAVAKLTIGKAIDQIIEALSSLEKREQQTVMATVLAHFELDTRAVPAAPAAPSVHATSSPTSSPPAAPPTHTHKLVDIRSLREEKQPDSARQMACVVAFYLQEHAPDAERKPTVNTADLERYFKQAGFKLPTKLEQLPLDCKGAGYFETVARGEYKLTRVGYNLVAHSLPKSSKAK